MNVLGGIDNRILTQKANEIFATFPNRHISQYGRARKMAFQELMQDPEALAQLEAPSYLNTLDPKPKKIAVSKIQKELLKYHNGLQKALAQLIKDLGE